MSEPKPSQVKLSAPIAKAVGEFHDASMHRMAKANAADEPTEPLFHYTSERALFSIIESEQFWFTSIYHMDDTEELTFGFKVARGLLQKAVENGDTLTRMFCEELANEEELDKIKKLFEFYSVSFGVKDDAKQWKKYADEGRGIALGLAPAFFKPLMTENPKPEEQIFLGKVVYGDAQARARHSRVIDEAIDTIGRTQKAGSIKDGKEARIFFQHMAAEMTVETLWNSVTTKDSSWNHQNETRLLALNNLNNPRLKIHNADKKPRLELPQPLLKQNITEVMVGPNADAGAEVRVRAFLERVGLAHVPVTRALMPMIATTYYDHRSHQILPMTSNPLTQAR
jgi:hypothetical protein